MVNYRPWSIRPRPGGPLGIGKLPFSLLHTSLSFYLLPFPFNSLSCSLFRVFCCFAFLCLFDPISFLPATGALLSFHLLLAFISLLLAMTILLLSSWMPNSHSRIVNWFIYHHTLTGFVLFIVQGFSWTIPYTPNLIASTEKRRTKRVLVEPLPWRS